jgi:paraquat-inducible protein B
MPEQPHQAVEQQSPWPGWIWAVPIAAVAIVSWLAIGSWTNRGPEVTVTFPIIADLKPDDTEVKFENLVVGRVKSVRVEKDFQHMRVKLQLQSTLEGHLGKGTQFWIVGRNFTLTNLSDLKTIISGPYVAMQPAPGPGQDHYTGLSEAPVLKFGERGTPFRLHSGSLSGIQHGTPIYYLNEKVGEVRSYHMTDPHGFDITALVKAPFDRLVHTGTRFWNASAIHLSNRANGPSLEFRSVPALVEGAIVFETPSGAAQGSQAKPYDKFELYDGQDAAENAPDAGGVSYRVVFENPANSLGQNAPVQLMGSVIGAVSQTRLQYSPATGRMTINAIIDIAPQRIQLADGQRWTDPRRQMDSMMEHLVAQGLRAEIASSPPAIGGHIVVLSIVPNTKGMMIPGTIPELPTASGSDISGTIQSTSDFVNKLNELPLEQIAADIQHSTRHIAALVSSPALPKTLHRVENSAANIDDITAEARDEVPAALRSARKSIAEAEATLASTQALVAANPAEAIQPESGDIPQALYEVTRAARSLRELSDYLDRHPEALIEGRGLHQ